jgi:hypothetical protein
MGTEVNNPDVNDPNANNAGSTHGGFADAAVLAPGTTSRAKIAELTSVHLTSSGTKASAPEGTGRTNAVGLLPWSRSQRRALAAIFVVATGVLLIRAWFNPMIVGEGPGKRGPRYDQLADRLDPNVADAGELAAIPLLGEKRAAAIVAYRAAFVLSHPNRRAFDGPNDLARVKGIGPATVETLEGYLVYPAAAAHLATGSSTATQSGI